MKTSPCSERLVIINVGTELVTTLALASAIEHARMPVLLVNCDPTPESSAHFDRLGAHWDFAVLETVRRPHGKALDWLFSQIKAELVLLLDSDAEIRDPCFVEHLQSSLEARRRGSFHVFGAGFIDGPQWLTERLGATPRTGLFNERPWMPCVMFRTSHIHAALGAGVSFSSRVIYNDFAWNRRISRLLGSRFQNDYAGSHRVLKHLPERARDRLRYARLPWLEWARRDYFGRRPNYVWSDTGTDIYQWCKYQQELVYAGVHVSLLKGEVQHYRGATRRWLHPAQSTPAAVLSEIEDDVVDRLASYGIDWNKVVADGGGGAIAPPRCP